MRLLKTALGFGSCVAIIGGGLLIAAPAVSQPASSSYVACNQYDECWRVQHKYRYPAEQVITIHNGDWYDAHREDARWLNDPADDRGWYDRDGTWRSDPGARALAGGATGAGVGAVIGCLVTLPIGCAPGAAVGAAIGGGTGAVAGATTTPH